MHTFIINPASRTDINNAKAVVPWKELLSRSEEYVGVKYLPADFTLMDPSHIRADDVICLLDHWYAGSQNETLAPVSSGCPSRHVVSSGRYILKEYHSEDDTDASCSDG